MTSSIFTRFHISVNKCRLQHCEKLVSFFFTFIILNTYSGRDECFVVLQRQYFCLTPHFSEPTQIFSEPDCIFCILSTQNTPFRGVLKLCLVTSFLSRNRRKRHLRGPRFQNFGGMPQNPPSGVAPSVRLSRLRGDDYFFLATPLPTINIWGARAPPTRPIRLVYTEATTQLHLSYLSADTVCKQSLWPNSSDRKYVVSGTPEIIACFDFLMRWEFQ